jgi:transcriptional/translational regulatory protein YebC/TACO1
VSWNFDTRGVLSVPRGDMDEDAIMTAALEAGASDVGDEGDVFEVYTEPTELSTVSEALASAGVSFDSAELVKIPRTYVKLEGDDARMVIKLVEALEDLDDVQRVSANFDIPDEILED